MRLASLLDKRTGRTRYVYAAGLAAGEVANIIRDNVDLESHLVTDESRLYWSVGKEFTAHSKVFHGAGNYATNGRTTNDLEGFFSISKRGMRGVYQFCNEKHLHRCLA